MMTQPAATLQAGTPADAQVPDLGASGAIAAVLGTYFVLYFSSRVLTCSFPIFLIGVPGWVFLGLWFLYQLIEANFGLLSTSADGGGVALFGLLVAWILTQPGWVAPQGRQRGQLTAVH